MPCFLHRCSGDPTQTQLDTVCVGLLYFAKLLHSFAQIAPDLIAVVVAPGFAQGLVPCCLAGV